MSGARRIASIFVALAALASTSSLAPPARGETRSPALNLSLAEAVSRALARGPEVALARHNVVAASAHRVGAGVVMPANPRLSIDMRPPITGGGKVTDIGYGAMLDFLFEVG